MVGLATALGALFAGAVQAACFQAAGTRYGIAPELLRAIAQVESGLNPRAARVNANGTVDRGLMQINSWWWPVLRRYGVDERDLWDPCVNITVGAWILAGNLRRYGNRWRAVGAYHAGTGRDAATERRRAQYANRVYQHLPCGPGRVCATTVRVQ